MASQYAPRHQPQPSTSSSVAASRVDSGYGGSASSVSDGEMTILDPSQHRSEHERRQWASHVSQLTYNQNRLALGRSVNIVIDTLKDFQGQNAKWPAHYPFAERSEHKHAGLVRSQTQHFVDDFNNEAGPSSRPQMQRRAATSIDEAMEHQPTAKTPRLVTPKSAEEFNVLKLDLKLGSAAPFELVPSLEKSAVSVLLDGMLLQTIKHLFALRERIEDTSSKVLITGDVNAGKSTFCNALMRRKVLPEDQQPCTSAFCEVLDVRKNGDVEEAHAIKEGCKYDRHDESTYDVYPLEELEGIVVDNDNYSQVKIYVDDVRPIEQSFLRNGVVDISLIDAPGLNTDSMKTTAVFARQEEIDVIVYVVAAENHFTLSAKEFIWNAANEKAYIFIVVNRFDNIRNKGKDKCQKAILEQVAAMSPQTYKDAQELVHFVSSNAVVDGTDAAKVKDFEDLEEALRIFVLEKRARSKLAPAKTYLLNLLNDIVTLAIINKEMAAAELEKIRQELDEISPAYERLVKSRQEVSDDCDRTTEEVASDVYNYSRTLVSRTISSLDDKPVVTYSGLLNAFGYAEATKQAMLQLVQTSVTQSETYAKTKTVEGVSSIASLGALHLGSEYVHRAFRPELMFSRKRDQLNKQVKVELDYSDFFDFEFATQEKQIAGAGMSLTLATVATSQVMGINSWADGLWKAGNVLGFRNARKLVVPAVALASLGAGYYLLSNLPNAVPRKLAKKFRKQLADIDYVHVNAERIANQCRKVLKFPSEDLRSGFQRVMEKRGKAVKKRKEERRGCEVADKYFSNLLRNAKQQMATVSTLDLEPHTVLDNSQEEQQHAQTQTQTQNDTENPFAEV